MPTLNFIGGEKGGTGKSFFTRALVQYLVDRQYPFVVFDTDRSNPDVKRCIGNICPVKLAIFSEAEKFQDHASAVFNTAMEQDVVCNLPAQVAPALHGWINDNELLELAGEVGVRFRMFWLTDAGHESLKLFEHSLKTFGEAIPHVLVKNLGLTDDFSPIDDEPAMQDLINRYGVVVLAFPRFIGNKDRNFLDSQSLSFGEALTHGELGPISRQRVKSFLKKAYAAFDAAGIFPVSEPSKPPSTPTPATTPAKPGRKRKS